MKKIMFTLAVAVAAASLQASSVSWGSASAAKMIDWSTLDGNGNYAAGGSNMRNNGTWAYVLSIVDGDNNSYLSTSGNMAFGSKGKANVSLNTTSDLTAGSTYYYTITITSSPAGLTGIDSDSWDYSGASMSTTLTGSFAAKTGTSAFNAQPSSWTVSGAVAKSTPPTPPGPGPIPEPTSGLLLLVGGAMLALRRKQK